MVRVKKSFCGLSLNAVGMAVAMLGIVCSILYFMLMIFAVGNVETFCVNSGSCDINDLGSARMKVWMLFFKSVLILGIHIALEVGVSKSKPKLIFAYIIVSTLIFLISSIGFITNAESFPRSLFWMAVFYAIFIYLTIILYSLKCDIEDAKKEKNANKDALENFEPHDTKQEEA